MTDLGTLPEGARILQPHEVTPEITTWAVDTLHRGLPIGSVTSPARFGSLLVIGRVEMHTWYGRDPSRPATPHPGVTVYALPDAAPDTDPAPAPAPPARLLGLDVSAFQRPPGHPIDWDLVKAGGYTFGFVKATEGLSGAGSENQWFTEEITGAKGAGLLVGAYHYFRTTSDPQAQVRRFYQRATMLEMAVDLPLVLDVESAVDLTNTGPSLYAHDVREALEELAGLAGRKPLLYISPSFAAQLPDVGLASVADLWVAHYGVTMPRLPVGFTSWIFWQFSGRSVVPGVAGAADANYFSGDLEALKAYAAE